jgi:hypothetical protein
MASMSSAPRPHTSAETALRQPRIGSRTEAVIREFRRRAHRGRSENSSETMPGSRSG